MARSGSRKLRMEDIFDLVSDILNETPKEQILVSRERLVEIRDLADNEPIYYEEN